MACWLVLWLLFFLMACFVACFEHAKMYIFLPKIAYFSNFETQNANFSRASGANYTNKTIFTQVPLEKPDFFDFVMLLLQYNTLMLVKYPLSLFGKLSLGLRLSVI